MSGDVVLAQRQSPPARGDGPRVALIGDSVMAGLGVRGKSFGMLIAQQLAASEVLVLARSEWTVLHAVDSLPRLQSFQPDLVLCAIGGSDAMVHVGRTAQNLISRFGPKSWRGTAGLEPRPWFSSKRLLRYRQVAGTAAKLVVKNIGVRCTGGYRRVEPDVFAETYPHLLNELLATGATVVCICPAGVDELFFPRTTRSGREYLPVLLQAAADRPDVVLVETDDLLRKWEDYLPDHAHLNPAGHRKVADSVISALAARQTRSTSEEKAC